MKLFTILLLFTFLPLHEQNPVPESTFSSDVLIEGKVVDDETGDPVIGAQVAIKAINENTSTDVRGEFSLSVPVGTHEIEITYIGYETFTKKVTVGHQGLKNLEFRLVPAMVALEEIVVTAQEADMSSKRAMTGVVIRGYGVTQGAPSGVGYNYPVGSEEYEAISENIFKWAQKTPLSTFSIDVDAASYSNVRRMIMDGYLPPVDAVRVEEMINYFTYNYKQPTGNQPFSINTEVAPAPWNPEHHLVQIGIQGETIEAENLPPSNLVFLLDVSGSMGSHDKLPLLKKGFKLLVNQLREQDYVSIVVYAGSSGLVLPPTSGYDRETILASLDKLQSGGSTAGAAGIRQAYQVAKQHFREDANNRVILATDGDFNVGISDNDELIKLIEEKRDDGIFLSVLGFGSGNLKDSRMEQIADHGNGNYYYIDNLLEAKKVLVSEMGGTLHTIAKDVKIQVEFNPDNVQAYRLIGYENRLLADEDFNDDTKDAGELGAGHTVTALYEVIPTGVEVDKNLTEVDPLKYQTPTQPSDGFEDELMTVKLRYKQPTGDTSKLISTVIRNDDSKTEISENLAFASAVASFGMLLRDSKFKGSADFEMVKSLARKGKGTDENGYRSEFIKIAELAELLSQGQSSK
jgi:Ca-activated chloride channel family protein